MLTVEQYDLSNRIYWWLTIVGAGRPLGTLPELAEQFGASPDDLRTVLDHLAEDRWVQRSTDDADAFVVGSRFPTKS